MIDLTSLPSSLSLHLFTPSLLPSPPSLSLSLLLLSSTLSGNHAQWQHPELSELYRSFSSRFQYSFYPSPAYPISLRLRCIQKHIQCKHIHVHNDAKIILNKLNKYTCTVFLSACVCNNAYSA